MMVITRTGVDGMIGFLVLLTLIFATLKLIEITEWSWWVVACPLWIPAAMIFGAVMLSWIVNR